MVEKELAELESVIAEWENRRRDDHDSDLGAPVPAPLPRNPNTGAAAASVEKPLEEAAEEHVAAELVTGCVRTNLQPVLCDFWRPQGDSNPRYRRERAMS